MFFSLRSIVVAAAIFTASVQATISRPMKGESWAAGEMQTVRWDSSVMKGRMKMHLCRGGATDISESILIISESVENTGSYNWMPDNSIESVSSFTLILVDINIESCMSNSDEFYISGLSGSSSYHGSSDNSYDSKDCNSHDSSHSDSHHDYKTDSGSHEHKTHSDNHEYKTHTGSHHEYMSHTQSHEYHDHKTYTSSDEYMTTTLSSVAEQTYSAYVAATTSVSAESVQSNSVDSASTTETSEVNTYTTAPIADSETTYSTLSTEVVAATYAAPPSYPTGSNQTYATVAAASATASTVVFTGVASSLRVNAGIIAGLGAVGLLFFL